MLRRSTILVRGCLGFVFGIVALAPHAHAYTLYSGTVSGEDMVVNLGVTTEYSNILRVGSPSSVLETLNSDDGDRNFPHGLVSNLFEVTPVLDVKWGNFGTHFSGEAYLNTVYLQNNDNNSPGTFNPISTTDNRSFTSATRNVEGRNARFLDAYAYDSFNFGNDGQQTFTVKVGRQTLLWGQSLFFSNNGIAAGQAPIDVITAQNLANPQTYQVILPVGQVVATYQPDSTFTFQGYWQFEYLHDYFQGEGAYFNPSDVLDKGGERLFLAPGVGILRIKDLRPKPQIGQFGASMQIQIADYDLGFFGLRYDSKSPIANFNNFKTYNFIYPQDIEIYGTSLSTNLGPANVAVEVSGRRNMPLFTLGSVNSTRGHPTYPIGSTVAAQASFTYVSAGIPLDPGGVALAGEFAMNHVLAVDQNDSNLAPNRDSTAGAFDISVTPNYYSVLPNLNVGFPIGLNYGLFGRSQIDGSMNHSVGIADFGMLLTYRATWTGGVNYQRYIGSPNVVTNSLADRGYVSFHIEHTF